MGPSCSTCRSSNACAAELRDARDEILATNEVLTAMGRSASDFDLVSRTIIDNARRLCRADGVLLNLRQRRCLPPRSLVGGVQGLRRLPDGSPDSPGLRFPRRTSRPCSTHDPDRRRARRPRLQPARRATDRGLPHDHGRADVARRRPRRGPHGLAHGGRPVRRPGDHAPHCVRGCGRHRRPQSRPRSHPRISQCRAGAQGRTNWRRWARSAKR